MSDETATNPVEVEDSPNEGTETETQEVELQNEPELDDEGNPIEREPEDEEVELDDLKIKVPKDQAQKVRDAMLRQADYTRKTQALAESVKAHEAERANFQQASAQEVQAQAQIVALDHQIASFNNVDWDAWEDQDPFAAQKGLRQLQQLKDARANAANQYVGLAQHRNLVAQQTVAKRAEETRVTLAKEIPGYSDETESRLIEFGTTLGFTREEAADVKIDPRIARFLHELRDLREQVGKQKKAQGHVAAQQSKPAAKTGGASPAPTGLADNLGTEEWVRRRNKQVAAKAA